MSEGSGDTGTDRFVERLCNFKLRVHAIRENKSETWFNAAEGGIHILKQFTTAIRTQQRHEQLQ
jgi:hypothetical protein